MSKIMSAYMDQIEGMYDRRDKGPDWPPARPEDPAYMKGWKLQDDMEKLETKHTEKHVVRKVKG